MAAKPAIHCRCGITVNVAPSLQAFWAVLGGIALLSPFHNGSKTRDLLPLLPLWKGLCLPNCTSGNFRDNPE